MSAVPPIAAESLASSVGVSRSGNATADTSVNIFEGFIQQTNEDQVVSDQAIQDLVEGKSDNVQQVVLAVAKAEMSFQLFMEIRNKLIESYNELMRMQF